MDFKKFDWIRTRDGSPTLWHNDEGAAFRSQKGAFTESLSVFVRPALETLSQRAPIKAQIVEFGLGPGTNWALFVLSQRLLASQGVEIDFQYTAIERDTESFEMGFKFWCENIELLTRFVSSEWDHEVQADLGLQALKEARSTLRIVPSLDALCQNPDEQAADIWFHDPFGFDINPSAYQTTELTKIRSLMAPESRGFSYACNSPFQKALRSSDFGVSTPETGNTGLKRERLEFWPALR